MTFASTVKATLSTTLISIQPKHPIPEHPLPPPPNTMMLDSAPGLSRSSCLPSLLNRSSWIEARSASDLLAKELAQARHEPLGLLDLGRMPAVGDQFEGSSLQTCNCLLLVAHVI